ncbi:hypothetical protein GW17_00031560 [Ensete ventricosum]|nr:hypothetical protein GW17_00031560 [Ensete ventricosum]
MDAESHRGNIRSRPHLFLFLRSATSNLTPPSSGGNRNFLRARIHSGDGSVGASAAMSRLHQSARRGAQEDRGFPKRAASLPPPRYARSLSLPLGSQVDYSAKWS